MSEFMDGTFNTSKTSNFESDYSYEEEETEDEMLSPLERMLREISYESIYDTIEPEYSSQIFMRSMLDTYKTE